VPAVTVKAGGIVQVGNFEVQPSFTRFLAGYAERTTDSRDEKILAAAISHLVASFLEAHVRNRSSVPPRFDIALPSGAILTISDWLERSDHSGPRVHIRRALSEHSPEQGVQDELVRHSACTAMRRVRDQVRLWVEHPTGLPFPDGDRPTL